jgi:HTH-type transcriptional regulator, competence development regulator
MIDSERIRQLRTQHGLSQGALGKAIGKDGQYVSKLERGILTSVTTDTLEQLASALDCSTDYLLGRSDEPRLKPTTTRQRTRQPAPTA